MSDPNRDIREPGKSGRSRRLVPRALRLTAFVVLCGVVAVGVVSLPNWGSLWAAGLVIGLFLAGLIVVPRFRTRVRNLFGWTRWPLAVLLAGWLGLIAWSQLSPGGLTPPPKSDPSIIRVVTWNILRGEDAGPPWQRQNWPARRHPLRYALRNAKPDVLCLQEALAEQLTFLEEELPRHRRVGTARGDGEHCAILYDRDRFEALADGTFWLEDPVREPGFGPGWISGPRICTWVRLRDRPTGRTFRVYNIHSYLTEEFQLRAAALTVAHVASGDPADRVILAGDFNARPETSSLRAFAEAGLADSADLVGRRPGLPTYQWYGIGLYCLDGVRVSAGWRVGDNRVLSAKPNNTFPSDHFGVLADLAFGD
jgi:endonuclease/exonuclease/phosphatase family metal-dependent hydrolase